MKRIFLPQPRRSSPRFRLSEALAIPASETLQSMRETFDLDRQWCLVTIAVSPLYRHSSDFPAAYERIADRIKHTPKEPQ